MKRTEETDGEMELDQPLTHVTEGEVEYWGRKVTIKINQETCVGASMCVISCPVDIFKSGPKSHLVKENLHKCLLQACMKCRDNCPTSSVLISFEESL
jgi:NAD-dependent dihydropyrimidine dehydrogenase PreA subunit